MDESDVTDNLQHGFPQRVGDWMQTYRGVAFYPLDPRPDEILVEDIAHALSMQCRFTGHTRKFYSVAQHCVHVSRLCDPADALWGLLHDASEAYLCDVARPIKRMQEMAEYNRAEVRLLGAIADRFGLQRDEPESVKRADVLMLGIEARDLMSPLVRPGQWAWCVDRAKECDFRISRTWSPREAEERYLDRFADLAVGAGIADARKTSAYDGNFLRGKSHDVLHNEFQRDS